MPFDEKLAARVRDRLEGHPDVNSDLVERKMFGGLAFLVRGHMCCGIVNTELMVRVGPEGYEELLAEPHTRPMDFTGRPLKGMLYVSPAGLSTTRALGAWVDRGLRFVLTLPPKTSGPAPAARRRRPQKTR
jgi:TfoX/Sxy family transcriptional regulator of competence genes